ncbi:alpha/beta hydrolase [Luteolibacter sp. AS25]|uniref:alpha/beta hydrolase n=1 Tax=Luteolibacter sp. AS25 TaxID=3135776 RepID=UPI00398AEC62
MEIANKQGERIDHAVHEGAREDVLVVYGHGVTGDKDRDLMVKVAEGLAEKGWPGLRISFSGNGASEGKFEDSTISKEVADLQAVLDVVKEDKKIVYVGHSMGGAVAALTAARDPRIDVLVTLAGMVRTKEFCEAEFGDVTPGEGCMWEDETKPLSQAFVDDLHQIEHTFDAAESVPVPWLLFHGTADDVVLPQDSVHVHRKITATKKLVMVEGAGHMFDGHYDLLVEEIDGWLSEVL